MVDAFNAQSELITGACAVERSESLVCLGAAVGLDEQLDGVMFPSDHHENLHFIHFHLADAFVST